MDGPHLENAAVSRQQYAPRQPRSLEQRIRDLQPQRQLEPGQALMPGHNALMPHGGPQVNNAPGTGILYANVTITPLGPTFNAGVTYYF